ncbi:unnamed protein product [Caenorhabditis sp. 36 PRJEB53466]|nr:unnamed protein product [Caenorhabditis sp. 36 PRJEB53466]
MEDFSGNRRHRPPGYPEKLPQASSSRRSSGAHGSSSKPVFPPPQPPFDGSHAHRKRPRSLAHPEQNARMPRKETDVVDRIWHDIDAEQREKQARKKAAAEEARKSEHPVTSAGQCVELTVNNLKNFRNDDSTVNDFIRREEMVDKLLGYKMLLGKMENCGTLGYEKMTEQEVRQLSLDYLNKNPAPDADQEHRPRIGPRTPKSPPQDDDYERSPKRPRRGPKTPPGSPGGPPPDQALMSRRDMVEQLANTFGQSTHEVEEALGGELDKALEDCSKKIKNEMMETFKAALKKVVDKKAKIASDLSDQMELVSDTSLSVDMRTGKREEPDALTQFRMSVPPPPVPPQLIPSAYPYYAQMAPPVYQYLPPPPQPPFQTNMMCYPPPSAQNFAPTGPPPQMHYQMPPAQQYNTQSASAMVLPPVNVPPPPMGVRIDTPIPQVIPPVVPPTGMPPPPIQTQVPPPMLPPKMQHPPPQPTSSAQYSGDCWRPAPGQPPVALPADSWQQQAPPPVPPAAPPVSADPSVIVNVRSTLFSALGLHKPPPPPPPLSSTPVPYSSLSVLPPPPPPPVIVPSTLPCHFPPPPPPPNPSSNGVVSSSPSTGYRNHGPGSRLPPFTNQFSNF